MGSPLAASAWDWARFFHICTETLLSSATPAPGTGQLLTLLVTTKFGELKGFVFKKLDPPSLFLIASYRRPS